MSTSNSADPVATPTLAPRGPRVFRDHGRYEAEFLTEFLVRCPRCAKRALVRGDKVPWITTRAILACTSCGHSESWTPRRTKESAIGIARRRCRYCSRMLEKKFRGTPRQQAGQLQCPTCRITVIEPVSWVRLSSPTCDPYFACTLWFVGDIKGDVFWAYNVAHLKFIESYVAATLRIREPNKNNSMASRLPAFLLAKKNRSAVLKEIGRLARTS